MVKTIINSKCTYNHYRNYLCFFYILLKTVWVSAGVTREKLDFAIRNKKWKLPSVAYRARNRLYIWFSSYLKSSVSGIGIVLIDRKLSCKAVKRRSFVTMLNKEDLKRLFLTSYQKRCSYKEIRYKEINWGRLSRSFKYRRKKQMMFCNFYRNNNLMYYF